MRLTILRNGDLLTTREVFNVYTYDYRSDGVLSAGNFNYGMTPERKRVLIYLTKCVMYKGA